MTTEKIRVSSLGSGIEEALAATEKLGAEGGLNEKQASPSPGRRALWHASQYCR